MRRSHDQLETMRRAGEALLECYRDLAARDAHLAGELIGDAAFEEARHYPAGDVRDPTSGAQLYFHAHLNDELGHFHTHVRIAGATPEADELVHLVGVSVDACGLPTRLFAPNCWATDDRWRPADELRALLDRFTFEAAPQGFVACRALPALLRLFRPQIEALLDARDAAVARDASVLDDRATRLLAATEVSIDAQIAEVQRAIATSAYSGDGSDGEGHIRQGG